MNTIIEKKHRLPKQYYIGYVTVSFTLCIKSKSKPFINSKVFDIFKDLLRIEAKARKCEILIYLFMPDHCHILLKGNHKNCNLLEVINRFKQKSGYWLSKNFPAGKY